MKLLITIAALLMSSAAVAGEDWECRQTVMTMASTMSTMQAQLDQHMILIGLLQEQIKLLSRAKRESREVVR